MSPSSFYNSHLESQSQLSARLSTKSTYLSTVRVVIFLVFITAIIYELNERELQASILLTIILVVVLGVLVKFHNKVKAQLAMAGYKTISEFACQVGVTPSRISRVVTGYEFPSVGLQNEMARALGINIKHLSRLL